MIHSLAGGEIKQQKIFDIVKVKILENNEEMLFICEDKKIKINDFVLVPYGFIDEPAKAQVIEVKTNVNSNNFPLSKRLKKIYKILTKN